MDRRYDFSEKSGPGPHQGHVPQHESILQKKWCVNGWKPSGKPIVRNPGVESRGLCHLPVVNFRRSCPSVCNGAEIDGVAQCRICFGSHSVNHPLVEACSCRGSAGLVHVACIKRWAQIRGGLAWKLCPTCRECYRDAVNSALARCAGRTGGQTNISEDLLRRLLVEREQTNGGKDPKSLYARNRLALNLLKQGKTHEATKLFQQGIWQ